MSPDYRTKIYPAQYTTTSKALRLLEKGDWSGLIMVCDSTYFKMNTHRKELKKAAKKIHAFHSDIKVTEGMVIYTNEYNVHRCIYYDKNNQDMIRLDMYFMQGNPESKIMKIVITNKRALKQEKKRREQQSPSSVPPPPPPPQN